MNRRIKTRARARLHCVSLLLIAAVLAGCTRVTVRRQMHEGNALYKAGEYEQAIQHYERAIEADPAYPDAWLNMGYAYRALFKPGSTHEKDEKYATEGIKAFRKYLEFQPENEGARQFFLEFCNTANRHDDAIAFLEDQLRTDPNNPQLIRAIASLYAKKGSVTEAMEWFDRWTGVEPQNPEAWYTIGVACWERSYRSPYISSEERREVIEKGISALGKALEIDDEYFEALSYMNLIYREKAKMEAAAGNAGEAGQDYQTAEQYMKKALEVRNAQLKAHAEQRGG